MNRALFVAACLLTEAWASPKPAQTTRSAMTCTKTLTQADAANLEKVVEELPAGAVL